MLGLKIQPVTLTKRQVQLLQLAADGYSTKEMAQQLSVAPQTVKNMLYRATRRLGVSNRTQAVAVAIGCGLIQVRGESFTRSEERAIAETALRRSCLRFEGIGGEYILVLWRNAKGQVASVEVRKMSGKKAGQNELERFLVSERLGSIECCESAKREHLTEPREAGRHRAHPGHSHTPGEGA